MKSFIKGITLVILVCVISFFLPGLMDSTLYPIEAGETEWSEEDSGGAALDAFTVVEIVPYKGMGEIGYLVGGEEPVNQELLTYNMAPGAFSFLGGAIDVYRSYREAPLPSSGTPDTGWRLARTIKNQNGYFQEVGNSNGGRYTLTSNSVNYIRVANGTGDYTASIAAGTDMDEMHEYSSEPTMKKNVKAYFVYGKPSGTTLFNSSFGYEPYSVKKNETHTGDYDYDTATGTFYLKKGAGAYDVIFARGYSGKLYYMLADYEIVDDNSGDYSFTITYTRQNGGNYIRETGTLFTYDRWNGTYRWVEDNAALTKPSNYYNDGSRIWVRNQKVLSEYQFTYNVQLVNNEWFKRQTLGVTSAHVDKYPVEVITITPEDLSKPENQHYIEEADLFYINSNYSHNQNYIMLYEKYSYEGLALPYASKYDDKQNNKADHLNFAVHDLNWDTTVMVYKKIAGIGCDKAAAVVDTIYYQDAMKGTGKYKDLHHSVSVSYSWNSNGATLCNLAKLYIMIYQRNMIDFYNSFLNSERNDYLITQVPSPVNSSQTTGSFIRPDSTNPSPLAEEAIYWNGNTFLPYGLNAAGEMVRFAQSELVTKGIVNYNITATPTDLTANVLSLNGADQFTSKFIQPITVPADSVDAAVVHISSINPDGTIITAGNITMANLTNVITNNGTGYEDTGGISYPDGSDVEGPVEDGAGDNRLVLNIEPTADFAASETEIKTILKGYNIKIVNMTSQEFNGSLEDINSKYDMIYMGSGSGRFNNTSGNTEFNDYSNPYVANGQIYTPTGDNININNGTESTVYYAGNDISSRRKSDLKDYLDAGLPIVLKETLYATDGVEASTRMLQFITASKTAGYKNFITAADYYIDSKKIAFLVNLKKAMQDKRPLLNLINPILSEASSEDYIYVDSSSKALKVTFAIIQRSSTIGATYDASLYVDENGDGIFTSGEKQEPISSDGSFWEELPEDNFTKYTYNYDMSELNGIYQWKLVVASSSNARIRSVRSGYAVNSAKQNLSILQLVDNASSYYLEGKQNDTGSLFKQYAGKNTLADYEITFDTMTVAEFNALYTDQPYTTLTADTTDKLAIYHLVILDNKTEPISTAYGALTNLQDAINHNLGIVFTKDALGVGNQSLFYSDEKKQSFLNNFTYNYINRYALIDQKYIYHSLDSNGALNQPETYLTTYATESNDGCLTNYPYKISPAIKIAASSYSNQVTVDFEPALGYNLIGWYCLSDAKSPIVQKAGLAPVSSSSDHYKGLYSSSPNDVKNNYYLFSNGKCIYSGIQLAAADTAGNTEEIKLFVNTILAAYKNSGRVISLPPVITIDHDKLVVEADLSKSITITADDIVDDEFLLPFSLTNSSSSMDLSIRLGTTEAAGSWDDIIYPLLPGSTLGAGIDIENSDKVVQNGSYVVKLPISALTGVHQLHFSAMNAQGSTTSIEVTLKFAQDPVVAITAPTLISGATTGYYYVDIDYNSVDIGEGYLEEQDNIMVYFTVSQAVTNVRLNALSEGEPLTGSSGVHFYSETDPATEITATQTVPVGNYIAVIPVSVLKQYSSREIIITATDLSNNIGRSSITFIRRSLFPLD